MGKSQTNKLVLRESPPFDVHVEQLRHLPLPYRIRDRKIVNGAEVHLTHEV